MLASSAGSKSLFASQRSAMTSQEDAALIRSLNTLLRCPLEKQAALKTFTSIDSDIILQKSVMEDIPVSIEKLQRCLAHSKEIHEYMSHQIQQNELDMKKLMH